MSSGRKMQATNSSSTLELAVNEQMQNMSRIDLSQPPESPRPQQNQQQQEFQATTGGGGGLSELKQWPARFCESMNAKLDAAKAKSETRTQYVLEVIQAFSGVIIWIFCFIFTIIMPLILLFIGLSNLDDCSVRPSLPYLVFAIGFVMTASNLFNLALGLDLPVLSNHSQLSLDIKNMIASMLNILFNCVVAFLYILTAYKTLTLTKTKQSVTDTSNSNNSSDQPTDDTNVITLDCNQTLYNFTFWFITITLGSMLFLSVLGAGFFVYNRYRLAIIRGSTPRSQTQPASNVPMNGQINTAFYGDSTNRV